MKLRRIFTLCAILLSLAAGASAATTHLAGGCFWCMESDFEHLEGKGVTDVVSGFTGGTLKNPIYNGNHAGHYEAVEISYDPQKISYRELLEYYWLQIDPFDDGGQFCDRGMQYTTAIFYHGDEQRRLAEASKKALAASGQLRGKIVTPIVEAGPFYAAEDYHQNFYERHPLRYKYYRFACGRDARLDALWGADREPSH